MTPTLVLPGLFVPGVSVYPLPEGQAMVPGGSVHFVPVEDYQWPPITSIHEYARKALDVKLRPWIDGHRVDVKSYERFADEWSAYYDAHPEEHDTPTPSNPPSPVGLVPFGSGLITLASWCPECRGEKRIRTTIGGSWMRCPGPCGGSGWVCRSANAEQELQCGFAWRRGENDERWSRCNCPTTCFLPRRHVLLLSGVSDELHAYPTPDKTGWIA